MIPGPRLLQCLAVWFGLTGVLLWTDYAGRFALFGVAFMGTLCAYCFFFKDWRKLPKVVREVPESFALFQWGAVRLRLESTAKRTQSFEVWEDLPGHGEGEGMPLSIVLEPGQVHQFTYRVRFSRRGDVTLGPLYIRAKSPWGWMHKLGRVGPWTDLRVFPDYAPVVRYALMALLGRESATGIRKRRLRGSGAEFHQLREYREGDPITTVDWKATARRTQLIVRDYQEERDQRVTFLVDCGARMRAIDGAVPLLDHSLNALLLLAYVALQQGDRVAIASFGGPRRWLPSVQGARGMTQVLKAVYDYQPTREVSDLENAAREVLVREPRRSLVVILTHLRPEDRDDVIRAHEVLRRRHLVLIASLRETSVQELLDKKVQTEKDAWRFAAASHYVQERAEMIRDLQGRGMLALDLLPGELPVALASEYLDVKAGGRL